MFFFFFFPPWLSQRRSGGYEIIGNAWNRGKEYIVQGEGIRRINESEMASTGGSGTMERTGMGFVHWNLQYPRWPFGGCLRELTISCAIRHIKSCDNGYARPASMADCILHLLFIVFRHNCKNGVLGVVP